VDGDFFEAALLGTEPLWVAQDDDAVVVNDDGMAKPNLVESIN
jgi:hypothetical protein